MGASRLRALTVKEIDKLTATKPSTIKHRYLGGVPGFVLVHTPNGHTSYGLIYRANGKRKKLTIGTTKRLTLGEARTVAGRHRSAIEAGADPHCAKVEARQQALAECARKLDVEVMWDKYMLLVASQLRTKGEKDRIFRRNILPTVQRLCVTEITKTHALKIVDDLVAAGKRPMADKVRQEGAAFFRWLVEREHVDRNIFASIRKARGSKVIRTRVLADHEVAAIWRDCEPEGRWALWVKLLILTGCRNMEVRGAAWSEFDLAAKTWTIPAVRYKNGHPHTVFLTEPMLALLAEVPRFEDGHGHDVDLLFPAVGNSNNPMSGDQKVKDRIDKRVRAAFAKEGLPDLGNWRAHDFRRTIATGLQRLGFRPDIADQVIGHVGSTRTGAAAHYLHHKYEAERKEALETWSNHVIALNPVR